ncbi:unnamed protein product [Microthlaspi erraticum]|uniref:Arabidopsis retrotransposon Orf1 C-terminal domain-containing protein n=1 Tax=Microthlaspi erraticum TaxID=1685480 RepID=A0A6D2J3X8_9BRAS|nr:unnamed protein product [Microthlaspi erraticum]
MTHSSESEQGEFEIGVNLVQEGEMALQRGSDETESEEEGEEKKDELPMYQEHYNALFSMDFVETKYPHDDTMRGLGIFEDVELVLKNMQLEVLLSPHGVLQGADLNLWNIKEDELQRVWATIAEEGYSSSRSKAARSEVLCLRYVHKALANTFFARKATGQSMREK